MPFQSGSRQKSGVVIDILGESIQKIGESIEKFAEMRRINTETRESRPFSGESIQKNLN
ncbi:hypothetical protein [Salibacterium halotolerans]|uniref:hypothetical protein n=1 Tax=Salibacterium halotolerans TaxID=1884432 RepID=UPI00147ED104|nr:hypothetical protein [Salibacterium halotolerans]